MRLFIITFQISLISCLSTANGILIEGDSVLYQSYFNNGKIYLKGGQYESAVLNYKAAIKFAPKLVDIMSTNIELARSFKNMHLLDSAMMYLNKNLNLKDNENSETIVIAKAETYRALGGIQVTKGNYIDAIDTYKITLNLLAKYQIRYVDVGYHKLSVGINLWRIGNLEEALDWTEKALFEAHTYEDKKLIHRCHIMLGLINWNKRDLNGAIANYKYVFSLLGDNKLENARDYFANCNNISLVYKDIGKYDSALYYCNVGLSYIDEIRKEGVYNSHLLYYRGSLYNNMGSIFYEMENYNSASKYYNKSLEEKLVYFGVDHPQIAPTFNNMGLICKFKNQIDEASSYFYQAMRINIANFGDKSHAVSKSYVYLGRLFEYTKEYKRALSYYDSALLSNPTISFNGQIVHTNLVEAWDAYYGQLQCKKHLTTLNKTYLDYLYEQINNEINFAYITADDDFLFDNISELLEELFSSYVSIYNETKSDVILDKLWTISELNKSRKLFRHTNNLIAIQKTIPSDLKEQEKQIRDSIEMCIGDKTKNPKLYDSLLAQLNINHYQFIHKLEKQFPKYYELKYSLPRNSINDIKNNLDENEAIQNFFEGEKYVNSILITQDTVLINRLDRTLLMDKLQRFKASILSRSQDKFTVLSKELSKMIYGENIPNLKITKIEIIPDGIMWDLDFGLLFDKVAGNQTESKLLFERVAFTYQYSYSYKDALQNINYSFPKDVLAFSYGQDEGSSIQLGYSRLRDIPQDLPGTAKEIKEIAKIWDGSYYFGSGASETVFKKKIGQYKIIHFALHGAIDDNNPNYSRLLFAESDSLNDGRLLIDEIYGMDIKADLAVLTSCNSGTGKLSDGEGIMSLGRGFMYSGVKSLLMSRWEVSDVSSPYLIKYFYEALDRGMDKSSALNYAKQQYLKNNADNITSAPYYWSSFYIMGDDTPLKSNRYSKLWLLWGLFLFIGLAIFTKSKKLL